MVHARQRPQVVYRERPCFKRVNQRWINAKGSHTKAAAVCRRQHAAITFRPGGELDTTVQQSHGVFCLLTKVRQCMYSTTFQPCSSSNGGHPQTVAEGVPLMCCSTQARLRLSPCPDVRGIREHVHQVLCYTCLLILPTRALERPKLSGDRRQYIVITNTPWGCASSCGRPLAAFSPTRHPIHQCHHTHKKTHISTPAALLNLEATAGP